jgi:hypothetical protein
MLLSYPKPHSYCSTPKKLIGKYFYDGEVYVAAMHAMNCLPVMAIIGDRVGCL